MNIWNSIIKTYFYFCGDHKGPQNCSYRWSSVQEKWLLGSKLRSSAKTVCVFKTLSPACQPQFVHDLLYSSALKSNRNLMSSRITNFSFSKHFRITKRRAWRYSSVILYLRTLLRHGWELQPRLHSEALRLCLDTQGCFPPLNSNT